MDTPRTLADKIWDAHVVVDRPEGSDLVFIDLHLVHEVTSPQAFSGLRLAGRRVRRPDLTLATPDHNVPTADRDAPWPDPLSVTQVRTLEKNCKDFGVPYFGLDDHRQGILLRVSHGLEFRVPVDDTHTMHLITNFRQYNQGEAKQTEIPFEERDLYDEEIRLTDGGIARLLSELSALSLESRTLVVLTADHGEEFGEHGSIGSPHTCDCEGARRRLSRSPSH